MNFLMKNLMVLLFLIGCNYNLCMADGCNPGDPCYEAPRVMKPVQPVRRVAPLPPEPVEPREVSMVKPMEDHCSWGSRIAAGVPVWAFQEEDTEVGGGVYADFYPCDYPLNLRVGAEIGHIGLDQPNALNSAEFPGKSVRATFVRIPLAVEYVVPLADSTKFFIGGGPDIINTANDVSDTSVGLHVSGRVLHEFDDHFGVALEAGYMWGEVDDGGGDIDLDNTFIIPTVSYNF